MTTHVVCIGVEVQADAHYSPQITAPVVLFRFTTVLGDELPVVALMLDDDAMRQFWPLVRNASRAAIAKADELRAQRPAEAQATIAALLGSTPESRS